MPSKDRVTMDMSPASAAALRKLAAELSVPLRDAAFHGAGLHAQMHLHLAQMSSERDMAWADLAASEEARRVAGDVARRAMDQRDEWQSKAGNYQDVIERNREQIYRLQGDVSTASLTISALRAMTAWDHLRAARAKAPFLVGFLFGIPPGCVAVATAIAMGVL